MKTQKISGILTVIAGLIMIGAVKIWAPVCSKTLEVTSGGQCHMKCFYYGQILLYMGILILGEGLILFIAKHTRAAGGIVILTAILMLVITNGNIGIGVCEAEGMMCQTTALWGRIGALIAIGGGILGIFQKATKNKSA